MHQVSPEYPEIDRLFVGFLVPDVAEAAETCDLLCRAAPYGPGIDRYGAFDAPSAAFAHAAPVLERVADQRIGRDRRDRLVEILHLDRRQRDFGHVAVGAVFRHRDPVAGTQHVVGRELHARHQSQDAVAEDEHQDGGRSSESGQDRRGISVDQDADNQYAANADGDEFEHLVDAFQRPVAERFVFVRDFVERVEKRAYEHERGDDQVDERALAEDRQQDGLVGKGYGQQDIPDQRRQQPAEVVHDLVLEQVVVPRHPGLAADLLEGRYDQPAEQHGREPREQQDAGKDNRLCLPGDLFRQSDLPEQFRDGFDVLVFHDSVVFRCGVCRGSSYKDSENIRSRRRRGQKMSS